ncbi:9468_t:CDS:2 [Funneliformis geosporum]|uniref:9468_t:CDS:1 n=1 Tax=Funneliformis geosporum TaxID=1117311 RepID=A0A9W4SWY9_9GLOM|nr:9468_t:CDS:2 [Funneliformis geosporum]
MYHNCIIQLFITLLSLTLVESAVKDARYDHSSAIIKDRLYILGGSAASDLSHPSSDIMYLDLKLSFNTFSPPWMGIMNNMNELTLASATTSKDQIILFGGVSKGLKNGPINVFDVNVQQWINPTIRGEEPESRLGVDIISDEGNKVYIFGGNKLNDSGEWEWFLDLRILNAMDFSWEPLIPAEELRARYTSVMLHGGVIAFIGGYVRKEENGQFSRSLVEMNEISLFHTFESKWHKEIAGGEIIEKRHGNITNELTTPTSMNSNIYILDTNNYSWISSYSYSNVSTSTATPQHRSDEISVGLIVGLIGAGIACTIIIIVAGILIHRKIWNRSDDDVIAIPTPGSSEIGNTLVRNDIVTVDDSNTDRNRYSVATIPPTSQSSNDRIRPISFVNISYSPTKPTKTSHASRPFNPYA